MFDVWQDDYMALANVTSSNALKMTLGMSFLNSYYQAHDMQRNQMALIPNIYNSLDDIQPQIVHERNRFTIVMPCATTLFICLLGLAAFYPVVNSTDSQSAQSSKDDSQRAFRNSKALKAFRKRKV